MRIRYLVLDTDGERSIKAPKMHFTNKQLIAGLHVVLSRQMMKLEVKLCINLIKHSKTELFKVATLLLNVMVLVLEHRAELRLWPLGLVELPSGPGPGTGVTRPPRVLRVLRGEMGAEVLLLEAEWGWGTALVSLGLHPSPASTLPLCWEGGDGLDVAPLILPSWWEGEDREGGGKPESFLSAMLELWRCGRG